MARSGGKRGGNLNSPPGAAVVNAEARRGGSFHYLAGPGVGYHWAIPGPYSGTARGPPTAPDNEDTP